MNCAKLLINNVMPGATTTIVIRREILKHTINKPKWNPKKCSSNPKESKKKQKAKPRGQTKINNSIKCK